MPVQVFQSGGGNVVLALEVIVDGALCQLGVLCNGIDANPRKSFAIEQRVRGFQDAVFGAVCVWFHPAYVYPLVRRHKFHPVQ